MKPLNVLLVIVSLVVLSALVSLVNVNQVEAALASASPVPILAALLVAFLSLVLRTLRWKVLLDDKRPIGLYELFAIQSAGLALSNLSPGKLLEPVKVVPLRKYGFGYGFALITVFWERAFDLLVLFSVSLLMVPLFSPVQKLVVEAVLGLLVLFMLLMFRHYEKLFAPLSKLPYLKFLSKLEGHDFSKRSLLASLILTGAAWFSDSVSVLLVLGAFGVKAGLVSVVFPSYCASVIVGVVSLLPGGLGTTEGTLVYLLSSTGAALPVLLAAALIVRVVNTGVTLGIGLCFLPRVKRDSEGAKFTLGQ